MLVSHVASNYTLLPISGFNLCNRLTNPNGDCSHFCFPVPDSQRVCGCPYGMKLMPNQQTCVEDPSNEPPTLQCGANSFSCGNGKCVPNSYRCDGVDDCHDNSDETSCGVNSMDILKHLLVAFCPTKAARIGRNTHNPCEKSIQYIINYDSFEINPSIAEWQR